MDDPQLAAASRRRRSSIVDGLQLPSATMYNNASSDERPDQGSRKRRHKSHDIDIGPRLAGEVDDTSYSSKRRRSANWPLTQEEAWSPDSSQRSRRSKGSHNRRQVSSPGRLSRFQEASMHDRASNQPPSVFTRFFGSSRGIAPIDQLMEDYHAANDTAPTHSRPSLRASSHQPSQSVTSTATTGTAGTANTRESGIFRFGRSLASTFNPINIWQKMQQKWSETRQELIEEALDEQARQLRERALKADEVYAHLKKTGQLGKQGTHAIPNGTQIFTPGYTAPAGEHSNQRDSGVAGIEPDFSRPYEQKDAAKRAADLSSPPERKSALHFKTPSFANLKKARSEAQLAKRAPPSSPTADLSDAAQTPRTLRRIHSKKDIDKQLQLHKRVSDLEAKLKDARRELYDCLGDASPVPTFPAHLAASLNSNKPRAPTPLRKRASGPAETLPTLPSESLLFSDEVDDREDFMPSSPPPAAQKDDEHAAAAQEVEPPTPTATKDIWIAAVSPVKTKSKSSKSTKPAPAQKRRSGDEEDLTIKPGPVASDDAEGEEAAEDPPKKRRPGRPKKSSEAQPQAKHSKQKRGNHAKQMEIPTQDESVSVLSTERAAKTAEKQPVVHASIDKAIESMNEDDVTTAKVLLRGSSPNRPSALATPSHPATRRSTRSVSPGRRRGGEQPEKSSVVSVVPNGKSVPPMPSVPENLKLQASKPSIVAEQRKASFEWPDDVF
ncbi:nuclear rna binding protein [Diplodia corticola]|uniref:Nuclear rna binding protein n=1 Tax=Diplodia corticola TaxID=236234 RepID=A0A1J9RVP5_9PEZI|nr:nuclear rna binding protein [Diplodia corticola]OJD31916.1 nuclear rna binding protein [Diplodia corticola]